MKMDQRALDLPPSLSTPVMTLGAELGYYVHGSDGDISDLMGVLR